MLNPSDIAPNFIELVIGELKKRYGVDFIGYNRNFLRRRIASRMNRNNITSPIQYYTLLGNDAREFSQLLQNLTINTTEFMRNPEVFLRLERKIFPAMVKNGDNSREKSGKNAKSGESKKKISIWSAGCSCGQEPYSLAMILLKLKIPHQIMTTIYATDIDEVALKIAREGKYDEASLKNLSPLDRKIFFTKTNNGFFKVNRDLKSLITFKRHDVIDGAPLGTFDMIICRNVSIYFTRELQKRMYRRFFDDLREGGYLITGKTEIPPTRFMKKFEDVDFENRIYRKVE